MAGAEPWYLPLGDEVAVFEAAYRACMPVLLDALHAPVHGACWRAAPN